MSVLGSNVTVVGCEDLNIHEARIYTTAGSMHGLFSCGWFV